MVDCFPDYCRLDLKECDLIQQNMVWIGSSRDRALFVRAVRDDVRSQVNRAIQNKAAGGEFEQPTHVAVSYDIAEIAINSLRPLVNGGRIEDAVHVEDLNNLVSSFDQKHDELRRQQIIGAQ